MVVKFALESAPFAAAIASAARLSRGVMGADTIQLHLAPDSLSIGATDGFRWFEQTITCKTKDKGALFVPAHHISQFAASLPAGSSLAFETQDSRLSVKVGRSSHKLPLVAGAEWSIPAAKGASIKCEGMREAIETVRFAMSDDPTRNYLRGVYVCNMDSIPGTFGMRKKFTALVAANGYEFGWQAIPRAGEFDPFMLPDTSIADISRALADKGATLTVSPSIALFETKGARFATKLVGDKFPDFARVIPQENNSIAYVECDELAAALDRVARVDNRARMYLDQDGMRIEAEHPDTGSASEHIATAWLHDPLAYGFKVAGLRGILESIEAERCALRFKDRATALIVNPAKDDSPDIAAMFLTMPVHIAGL